MITKTSKNGKEIKIYSWGKSMYGGWYANFIYAEGTPEFDYMGVRRDTLDELCKALDVTKAKLNACVARIDN